jgi:transcription initiation factor IIE alpha subunit
MATGWESKSVLEQQLSTQPLIITEEKERISREKAIHTREVQTLKLSCARVKEQLQRSQSSRYSELLQRELHHLESELARKR